MFNTDSRYGLLRPFAIRFMFILVMVGCVMDSTRNLGVIMDSELRFGEHISYSPFIGLIG